MAELDPLTGKDPSSLSVAQLAERLAMERALREQEYKAMREALDALKALFTSQATSDRRALELQAIEYERRLDTLNHAHKAAVEAQAQTVPREMFEQFVKENAASQNAAFEALGARLGASIKTVADAANVGRQGLLDRMDAHFSTTAAEIEVERNARIRAEGAISVWRFIAVLLGLPGIIALLLAMVALFGQPA